MNPFAPFYVNQAAKTVEKLPPLDRIKSPAMAGLLGFTFGPIGIGLYLGSLKDFLICFGLLIGLTIVAPGGGSAVAWVFAGGFGWWRVTKSNERLEAGEQNHVA